MISDGLVVYFWLLPVILQLCIPIVIMCIWMVIKLPILFVMREAKQSQHKPEPVSTS